MDAGVQSDGSGRLKNALTFTTATVEIDAVPRLRQNAKVPKQRPSYDVNIGPVDSTEGPYRSHAKCWGQFVKVLIQADRAG
jgi:hypothetical protein